MLWRPRCQAALSASVQVLVARPCGRASLTGSVKSIPGVLVIPGCPDTRKDPNCCEVGKSPGARLNPPRSSLVRVPDGVQRQAMERKLL